MNRYALIVCAALGFGLVGTHVAQAGDCCCLHSLFCKKPKCQSPEEARLQQFWHDYYAALKCYYSSLDKIDWVAYYKNHGYQINAGCGGGMAGCGGGGGCPRVNYAPVFVSPVMQWAVPNSCLNGPPGGGAMPAGGMGGMGGY